MDYTIIYKYFAGEASEQEVSAIYDWINASPENRDEFIRLKKAWALTAKSNDNTQKVWNEVMVGRIRRKDKIRHLYTFVRYAAVIVLFFSLGMIIQNQLTRDDQPIPVYEAALFIDVPLGQMSNVELPDGTTVQLNSGSRLSYAGNFSAGERVLHLDGEAFFDVAKDPDHPFIVKTNSLDFRVYGTSFNIQAYELDIEVNTTLVEGSLAVIGKSGKEITRLVPGENANYAKNSQELQIKNVKLDIYTSWKDGLISFRNEKLQDIAKKMERWYNVEIQIKNQKLADETYFGTIMKNKPIDQILEVFSMTSSLKYRIIPRPGEPTLIYWE
ncbi:FecR family protein [Mangrovibacterium sp.]|uniref:FecR family protein n=1 Tax=Mangrovibacterium sp. TaxID=1961364 RepID=UPI003566564C